MNVVCLSSIDWDFIWQGHQEIMSRLGRMGHSVLFVENTGVRRPGFSDAGRLWSRLRNRFSGLAGFREVSPGVTAYAPLAFPFPYSRWAVAVNCRLICRAIRRWMELAGGETLVGWSFLPTLLAQKILNQLQPAVTIYYCIDNFGASSTEAARIEKIEAALFRKADLVFVTSRALRAKALRNRKQADWFPFAVNLERFSRPPTVGEPSDLAEIPHPRAGYVGGLHRWVDFELLSECARRNPGIHFPLVGPIQADLGDLKKTPNVYLLGAKPHEQLPDYIRGFDAGLIPYRLTEYTANVYPTKLNEYFALGLPVVGTALPELETFNREFGEMVEIAGGAEDFFRKVAVAVGDHDPSRKTRRTEVARLNGWDARIDAMLQRIEEAFQAKTKSPKSWPQIARGLTSRVSRFAWAGILAVLAAMVLVRLTPMPWRVFSGLRIEQLPQAADGIVVLAGGVGESGEAGQGHEERLGQALALWRDGWSRDMIFSSGITRTFQETEVMKALAIHEGVDPSSIYLESVGGGVRRCVVQSGKIARGLGWKSVLLVTSPYNMKRATEAWRRANPDISVRGCPVEDPVFFQQRPLWQIPAAGASWQQLRALVQEWLTYLFYRWKGWA